MKLYQYAVGKLRPVHEQAIELNKKIFGKDYELVHVRKNEDCTDLQQAAIDSDRWRFDMARKTPDFLFICLDGFFLTDPRPTFTKTGAPYMAAWKGRAWGGLDPQGESAALYCNNCCQFFADRLDFIKNGGYGAQMATLRDVPFFQIEPHLFFHKKAGLYG